MNNRLYELIDRKYLKEVRYINKDNELSIDIQNKDVVIRFLKTKHQCISITVKMDSEQNREIYNIIKNELTVIHKPYQEFVEIVEDKENDNNIHSVFIICVKEDSKNEKVRKFEEEYIKYLLNIVLDFDKNMYQESLNAIKENKNIHIIAHGEGGKDYEIFL